MWYILLSIIFGLSGVAYYYYKNRYNDEVTELFSVVYEDLKCIKYQYRGKKYLYLTNNMNDDIVKIQKEIDPMNTDKDKRPDFNYKSLIFKVINTITSEEIMIEKIKAESLIYSFVGPANTYYFAFDTVFYDKLTKFMNYLFFTEEGSITYGRISSLLQPEIYFDIKNKINQIIDNETDKKNIIEWSFV